MNLSQNQYGWWQLQLEDQELHLYPDMFIYLGEDQPVAWRLSDGLSRQLDGCKIYVTRTDMRMQSDKRKTTRGYQFASQNKDMMDIMMLRLMS